ncbi:MAG: WecB/TagA/CpsF family glycosyltransferase [Pseudomonadota bacterium]
MYDFSQISRAASPAPIRVNAETRAGLLAEIARRLAAGEGFSLATLNVDHLVKIARDPAFRAAYAAHDLVTADGNPIVWLCRLAGQKGVELVPGSEIVEPVAELAAKAGVGVALLGSTEASLAAAAAALQARHRGLQIVAQIAPPMGFDPDGPGADDAIAALAGSGAGLCYLALGAPKQERFAARAQTRLPEMGFLSIGAGLDFVAGTQVRAPVLVRRLALEWLWRLGRNPRRLAARYAACFAILPRAAATARRARLTTEGAAR